MKHNAEQFDFIDNAPPPPREADICRHKHGGNEHSEAARPSQEQMNRDQAVVLDIIKQHPHNGATLKEIAVEMGKERHQISARITELKAKKLVYVQGRRDGCGINYPATL